MVMIAPPSAKIQHFADGLGFTGDAAAAPSQRLFSAHESPVRTNQIGRFASFGPDETRLNSDAIFISL